MADTTAVELITPLSLSLLFFDRGWLYFCDYDSGREYLGQVVAWLVSRFGAVVVTEL